MGTLEQNTSVNQVIFSFFGPPGSGKGTLAEKLAHRLEFEVLSTGNLCRKHVAQGTELGKALSAYLEKGELIPDNLVTKMVQEWLEDKVVKKAPIILDGYPRTKGQANKFLEVLPRVAPGYGYRVILIDLADDEIVNRLTSRRVCSNKSCQAVYAPSYKDDICEHCKSSLTKRQDDSEEVIRARLKSYPGYRATLLEYYTNMGQEVEAIDVAGMDPEHVYNTFCAII